MSTDDHTTGKPPTDWQTMEQDGSVPPPKLEPQSLAQRQSAALEQTDGETMPVLAAFQEFLETERIRSRNRMIAMSVTFAVILVLVVVAGVILGLSVLRPVQDDFQRLQVKLADYERLNERAADRVDRMIDRVQQQDRRFQEQIAAERQAHADTRAKLDAQQNAVKADLGEVQSLVEDMRAENLQLKRNVASVQADLPNLIGQMRDTLRGTAAVSTVPSASTAGSPAPSGPERVMPLALRIPLEASPDRPLTWRLIVPE